MTTLKCSPHPVTAPLKPECTPHYHADLSVPHQTFHPALFRQPSLAEGQLKPQPYRRVYSLSDPFSSVRARDAVSKGSYDSPEDQQKSPHRSSNERTQDSILPEECGFSIDQSKGLRISREESNHMNPTPFPPVVQISKGMGLNMCEFLDFNSSLSSADPAELDCYHSDKRYNPARSRSISIDDEEEERDSGDDRDVNEILGGEELRVGRVGSEGGRFDRAGDFAIDQTLLHHTNTVAATVFGCADPHDGQ